MKRCKDCNTRKRCNIDLVDDDGSLVRENIISRQCEYYVPKPFAGWLWFIAVVLLTLALLLGGCMTHNAEKTTYRPDGNIESRTKASMAQCLVDSSRTDFKVEVEGLGKASVGSSVIDAESLAEIIKALPEGIRKEIFVLLGVNL